MPPSQERSDSRLLPSEPGLLTHLTQLTRLSFDDTSYTTILVPNDPAALLSAGGSLRVLELAQDYDTEIEENPRACIEALLPVAAGLDTLVIHKSGLDPADATRLAAALPRDMARLHISPTFWVQQDESAWAALPVTSLELLYPPTELA